MHRPMRYCKCGRHTRCYLDMLKEAAKRDLVFRTDTASVADTRDATLTCSKRLQSTTRYSEQKHGVAHACSWAIVSVAQPGMAADASLIQAISLRRLGTLTLSGGIGKSRGG